MNSWLKIPDDALDVYLHRELEMTEKGQLKSSITNLITILVNPQMAKARGIYEGEIFFDTCSQTVRFVGHIKGEPNTSKDEIRKWNDQMTNLLGIEIDLAFGLKYAKNLMEEAVQFIAMKCAINMPAQYLKGLPYRGEGYIDRLLPTYLGVEDTPLSPARHAGV